MPPIVESYSGPFSVSEEVIDKTPPPPTKPVR
jgi:hypothetical protein